MQVEMLMCIDMIERQPSARKCHELRTDLGLELLASGGTRKIPYSPQQHILAHASIGVRDPWDLLVR